MKARREQWLKYHTRPRGGENRLGPWGTLVWPLTLKAGRADDGKILWQCGETPATGLAIVLGARGLRDRRLVERGLRELLAAGLVTINGEHIEISGWKGHRPRRAREGTTAGESEWMRLYVDESPAFSRCSLAARGFAACLMRAADPAGAFLRDPRDLFIRLRWAARTNRHIDRSHSIEQWLDELVEVGWLERLAPGELGIVDFDRFVGLERPATEMRPRSAASHENHTVEGGEIDVQPDGREMGARWARDGHERGVSGARAGFQESVNSAELLDSRSQDLIRSDQIRSPLKAPPQTGGQVSLFSDSNSSEPDSLETAEPDRPGESARVRGAELPAGTHPPARTRSPHGAPDPFATDGLQRAAATRIRRLKVCRAPDAYSPWFEDIWKAYPSRNGHKPGKPNAFVVAQRVAPGYGGPEAFRDRVLEALAWQTQLTEWREGIGIPDCERYLKRLRFLDERPGPEAFADRTLPPWERQKLAKAAADKAAREQRRREIDEENERDQNQLLFEHVTGQAEALLVAWREGRRLDDPLPESATSSGIGRRFWREFGPRALCEIVRSGSPLGPLWARQWQLQNPTGQHLRVLAAADVPTPEPPADPIAQRTAISDMLGHLKQRFVQPSGTERQVRGAPR